jgi:hypothetical protein
LYDCHNGARISDYAWDVTRLESKTGKWTLYGNSGV